MDFKRKEIFLVHRVIERKKVESVSYLRIKYKITDVVINPNLSCYKVPQKWKKCYLTEWHCKNNSKEKSHVLKLLFKLVLIKD